MSKPLCTAAAIFCCPIFLRIVDLISSTDFKSVIQHSCGDVERKAKSTVRKDRQLDTISPRSYHVLASMYRIFNVFPPVVPFPVSREIQSDVHLDYRGSDRRLTRDQTHLMVVAPAVECWQRIRHDIIPTAAADPYNAHLPLHRRLRRRRRLHGYWLSQRVLHIQCFLNFGLVYRVPTRGMLRSRGSLLCGPMPNRRHLSHCLWRLT